MKKLIWLAFFLFVILSNGVFAQGSDKSLDGIWQLSTDSDIVFVFRGDTWRVHQQGEIIGSGVFKRIEQGRILCIIETDKDFEVGYSITGDALTITNSRQNLWLIGLWKKISSKSDLNESNRLVGTWKNIAEDGSISIYQFYPDGSGVRYNCEPDMVSVKREEKTFYIFTNNTRGGIGWVFDGFIFPMYTIMEFEIKNNELTLGTTAYMLTKESEIKDFKGSNDPLTGGKYKRE